jgi:hypothetical protein
MIKIGSKWKGSDYKLFVVENVDQQNVYYSKCNEYGFASNQNYNCSIGAFLQRFRETAE